MQEKKIIVGLGNIGKDYENTRHNTGFIIVNLLAKEEKWHKFKNSFISNFEKFVYVKPTTFMNNSGVAVKEIVSFYKISLDNLIIIHDDMDIKLGQIKIKQGGSSAGHNGIKSIDALCGNNYKRIRVGIGHPKDFNLNIDPADFVLQKFKNEELDIIKKTYIDIYKYVLTI